MEDKRRRLLLGGMMAVLVVFATAAMMWPGRGFMAPTGASAFPGITSISEILVKVARERRAEEQAPEQVLRGSTPDFAALPTVKGSRPKKGDGGKKNEAGKKGGGGKKGEGGKKATASGKRAGAGAAASGADPTALSVAREFAQAFVIYETGGEKKTFKAGFDATATDQLVKALLQRPPRQPASVKVPQAKVVTVVAGPSKGKVHQVSVSLLRVGVTSELRLDLERGVGKQWQVTNVLG